LPRLPIDYALYKDLLVTEWVFVCLSIKNKERIEPLLVRKIEKEKLNYV